MFLSSAENAPNLLGVLIVAVMGHFVCLGLLANLRDGLKEIGYEVNSVASRILAIIFLSDPLGILLAALLSPVLVPLYLKEIRATWPRFRLAFFSWMIASFVITAAWILMIRAFG